MKLDDTLNDAAMFAAERCQTARAAGSEEEARLWGFVRYACVFVTITGQIYRYEDHAKAPVSAEQSAARATPRGAKSDLIRMAREMILGSLERKPTSGDKQRVAVLMAVLDFIADTGQTHEMEDFFLNQRDHAHLAIRYFATHGEAEAWLDSTTQPPSSGLILIGDQYWWLWYDRESNVRSMYRDIANEPRVEDFTRQGIPPGAPEFQTRSEAEGWLQGPPAASEVFVRIAGEYYFAFYQKRLQRHSLHHVETALREWEQYKRESARRRTVEAVKPSE